MSHKAACWALYQKNLSPIQKLTLITLADCHNGATGQCNPSLNYIVEITGANRKTVISSLQYLEVIGMISRQRGFGKGYFYTLDLDQSAPEKATKVPKTQKYQKGNLRSTENGTSKVPKTVLMHYIEPGIEPGIEPCRESNDSQPPSPKEKTQANYTAEDYKLAEHILVGVQSIDSRAKANIPDWANTIRLMRERDGRSPDDMRRVFDWANDDDFWRSNVLSPKKLRQKFTQLVAQMARSKTKRQSTPTADNIHNITNAINSINNERTAEWTL